MPGKKVQCASCSRVMRSDNLRRHIHSCVGVNLGVTGNNHTHSKSELFKQLEDVDDDRLQTPWQQETVQSDIEEDVSSAEDEEDENMNRKVWRVILHYSNANEYTPMEAFKDFCRWCRALEKDPIIEKVIDSAQMTRDEATGFKEALDEALNERKFLIMRAIENRDGIVWKELEDDPDALESLRRHILFSRAMKRDPTFQKVMEYKKECMVDEDMDSDEALDHSIDEKGTDIIEAQGKGLYLHPYGKGLSEEDAMHDKIWEIIARKSHPYDYDPFSSFKFFCHLRYSIDHDSTFQHVLNEIEILRNDQDSTFEDALDNVMEREKPAIHRAFENAKEKCQRSGEDEGTNVWCSMLRKTQNNNIDVFQAFKIFMFYYQSINSDKVFQAVMKTLDLVVEDDCELALDFAIQSNKSRILKAISIARNESGKVRAAQPGHTY